MKNSLPNPIYPALILLQYFRNGQTSAILARVVLVCFFVQMAGCNYYRTESTPTSNQGISLSKGKYFILHQGSKTYSFANPSINGEFLEGLLGTLAPNFERYANPEPGKAYRYKNTDKNSALNIVHIYINEYTKQEGDRIAIPVNSIKRIDVVERDTGRTVASHVLGSLALTAAALTIISIIVLLTKSSCPFVYAYNGENYNFVGETYGGAIFSPLERQDFMPLPGIREVNNEYRIKITNELKERQYTNLAELWLVAHPDSTEVLLDQKGKPQVLSSLQPPISAIASDGEDYTAQLIKKDSASFLFNDTSADNAQSSIVLTFRKTASAQHGKLVLRAQNSLWLDYLFGEFTKKFGSFYNTWAAKQKSKSFDELNSWQKDQGIPLLVSIETDHGWQPVEAISSVGPLAARNLVVPLDFSKTGYEGEVKIKLSGGFMFWEVDYAAMDLSAKIPLILTTYKPASALTQQGKDARKMLLENDQNYLTQTKPGTSVELKFRVDIDQETSMKHTVFLRTKGYYEHVRNYEGIPDMAELSDFRKPGRFIEFSKEKYNERLELMNRSPVARR